MIKLNLPIIREELPPPKALSLDDYVKFLRANLKYFFNRKAYEDWKKRSIVDAPFVLK